MDNSNQNQGFEELKDVAPSSEYFYLIAHDLNSGYITARGLSERYKQLLDSGETEKSEECWKRFKLQEKRNFKVLSRLSDKIDDDTGKMILRVRALNVYDDTIKPFLEDYEPEIREREIRFNEPDIRDIYGKDVRQDRGILTYVNRVLLKNVMDCGKGTKCNIKITLPVKNILDEDPVSDGGYVKIRVENTVPNPELKKEGAWGLGTKIAKTNIILLGGQYPNNFLERYERPGECMYAGVEYMIPLDLKKYYAEKTL